MTWASGLTNLLAATAMKSGRAGGPFARVSRLNLQRSRRILEETVVALAATAERRDPYTAGHQRRVAQLAYAIAKELGLDSEKAEGVRMAAIIHDVGKVYVPSEILSN